MRSNSGLVLFLGGLLLVVSSGGCIADGPSTGEQSVEDVTAVKRPASRVEIKLTVASEQIDHALDALELAEQDAEQRDVFFYDTLELDLYASGVILRGRNIHGDDDESTVKIRPLLAGDVAKSWFKRDGFKCELDRTASDTVSACSLTVVQGEDEIEDVAAGDRSIEKLFSSEQESLLEIYADLDPDWGDLEVLGPVDASVWKLESPELDRELVVERWTLPDGSALLELSVRADADEADAIADELDALVESLGVDAAGGETKTKAALTYFVGSLL